MKKLLTILSVLTIGTTTGNLSGFLNTTIQKTNTLNNHNEVKTNQDTIYIDENGNQQTTSEHNLLDINSTEIVQIGFYKNQQEEIQVVTMPKKVKKVPNQLPPEITSLSNMFAETLKFNQNISRWNVSNIVDMSYMFSFTEKFNKNISAWNTSNVTNMMGMFYNAKKFNKNISRWNVSKVTNHQLFSTGSGIDNHNKLPKFDYDYQS